MTFIENNKIAVVEAAASAAQTALDSDVLDMSAWDSATFIALLGDVSDGSVLTLTLFHGDSSDGSDAVATTLAATFTAGASNADSKALAISVRWPLKRYIRARLTRGTANAIVGGIIAIQHEPKYAPVTQDASILDHDFAVSPASA
jgi:hypothetical protein